MTMVLFGRPTRRLGRFGALAAAFGLCACAASAPPRSTADSTADRADALTRPDLERLEAIYRARQDSALLEVHEADVRFMTGMIHHHAQALVMSAPAEKNGASRSIRTLTARIVNAQRDEIAVMQRWLGERGRPVPEVDEHGRMAESHAGMAHAMHMPGMLTERQLESLGAARGSEYDRLFLEYMIQHHNGAVAMVHDLFATDGAAQDDFVFELASDIQVDQRTEVARMERMLEAMPSR